MGLAISLKERAQTLLLEAPGPLTRVQITESLQTSTGNVYNVLHYLKLRNGSAFVKNRDGYLLLSTGPNKYQKFTLPDALLRGWVDPITGIVPTHLGL